MSWPSWSPPPPHPQQAYPHETLLDLEIAHAYLSSIRKHEPQAAWPGLLAAALARSVIQRAHALWRQFGDALPVWTGLLARTEFAELFDAYPVYTQERILADAEGYARAHLAGLPSNAAWGQSRPRWEAASSPLVPNSRWKTGYCADLDWTPPSPTPTYVSPTPSSPPAFTSYSLHGPVSIFNPLPSTQPIALPMLPTVARPRPERAPLALPPSILCPTRMVSAIDPRDLQLPESSPLSVLQSEVSSERESSPGSHEPRPPILRIPHRPSLSPLKRYPSLLSPSSVPRTKSRLASSSLTAESSDSTAALPFKLDMPPPAPYALQAHSTPTPAPRKRRRRRGGDENVPPKPKRGRKVGLAASRARVA